MTAERVRIMVAEFIGTFALTFIGILSITGDLVAGAAPSPVSLTVVAFAHGLILAVMIAALGQTSGGHFNPAVTFGFVTTGRMPLLTGALYWIAQLVGAALASYMLLGMTSERILMAGTPSPAPNVGVGMATVLEGIATFFLVLVVFGTAVDERAPKSVFPFAIGLALTAGMLGIGTITGGSINPARAFGPALATGDFAKHYVYWIGPLIGGALGAGVHHFLLMRAPTPIVAERGGPAPSEKR